MAESRPTAGRILSGSGAPSIPCNTGAGRTDVFIRTDTVPPSMYLASALNTWSAAGAAAPAWGTITGTLSSQTDLQTALNLKANLTANTFTGAQTNSTAGALNVPAMLVSGAPVTGGSATTTKPLVNIETAGAASTAWPTAGTMLGVNAPSGFTGSIIEAQLNGASMMTLNSSGSITIPGAFNGGADVRAGASSSIYWNSRLIGRSSADSKLAFSNFGLTGLQALALGPTQPATIGAAPAQGQTLTILQAMELLTIAAAATTVTAMSIPAGAIVLSVSVRVTTVIPTAATFTVIGNTTTTVFNTAAVSTAATSTDVGTAAGAFYNAAAQTIRITPNLTPGAATGVVRITVAYIQITPSTS